MEQQQKKHSQWRWLMFRIISSLFDGWIIKREREKSEETEHQNASNFSSLTAPWEFYAATKEAHSSWYEKKNVVRWISMEWEMKI